MAEQIVGEWRADGMLPSRRVDSASSTRQMITGIALREGDKIRIECIPDGREKAAIDYMEIK